jgi:YesN/AraC family two-component response regulator
MSTEFKDYLASSSESIRLLMQNRKFNDTKKFINNLLNDKNAEQFTLSSANSLISLMTSQLSLLIALYDFSDLAQEVEALQSPVYLLNFHNISQWRDDILRIVDRIELCFSQHNQDDLVIRVQKYLADNYASDWDLSELAALFYVNSSYLSHIFKKKTGKTISAYIEDLRIQNACVLLRTTNISIGDIAAAVGYSDPNYFAKRFRKKIKNLPSHIEKPPAMTRFCYPTTQTASIMNDRTNISPLRTQGADPYLWEKLNRRRECYSQRSPDTPVCRSRAVWVRPFLQHKQPILPEWSLLYGSWHRCR